MGGAINFYNISMKRHYSNSIQGLFREEKFTIVISVKNGVYLAYLSLV